MLEEKYQNPVATMISTSFERIVDQSTEANQTNARGSVPGDKIAEKERTVVAEIEEGLSFLCYIICCIAPPTIAIYHKEFDVKAQISSSEFVTIKNTEEGMKSNTTS